MKARKRFGQHFLKDERVLNHIVSSARLQETDTVIEIGPGRGALTTYLAAAVDHLFAVEIDRDLVPMLKVSFPNATIINEDILRADLSALLPQETRGVRLVGNLPYNISSPLILKLADLVREHPGFMADSHFMLQKEMAERLAAVPGSKAWGRLSVMAQVFFEIDLLFDVGPESFSPPPKVMSSVIRIMPRPSLLIDEDRLALLDRILKTAFAARRKRLANALKSLDVPWDEVSDESLNPDMRADDVSLVAFIRLAEVLSASSEEKE